MRFERRGSKKRICSQICKKIIKIQNNIHSAQYPINGNKYLSLLCNAVRPSFCAIKLFCDEVKIDFFSQNLDHTHFNHKNPIQYLPLIGLSNKRVNIDKSNDGQITIDHNIAEILEYIIEASILSF